MKKPGCVLKAATVFSSVLLVAGYIGYRAGAFDWLLGSREPERFQSSSKLKVLSFGLSEKAKDEQSSPSPQPDPTFMYRSKSIILVSPAKAKETLTPNRTSTQDPKKNGP
jgi:hypothetical protein